MKASEHWVWTELLAFDNAAPDRGVAAYCERLGFVPGGVCLLVSSIDFILQHEGLERERTMSPLICSRDAHAGNEERARQEWTNLQIRDLVQGLAHRGCRVFLSQFTPYHRNAYHREWVADHEEALQVWVQIGRGLDVNILSRLNDGRLLEDVFIPQAVQACLDYGFAGWHGPDGFGPLGTGNIWGTDMSDQMISQFRDYFPALRLPPFMTCPCPDDKAILAQRAGWLAAHRHAWIDFYIARWVSFWRKMNDALHAEGLKSVINSAWTKGSFEAMFSYGIDYRRMAELGIDHMVVESVALSLSLCRPHLQKHYDFAATLLDIKACAPRFKLLFLHAIKDVVENWDALRHSPAGYERELFALANMYTLSENGLQRAADGLLACLADGISSHEWDFIRGRWQAAFSPDVLRAGQVVMVYADEQLDGAVDDYLRDGMWCAHWQTMRFLELGVQIQTSVRSENLHLADSALLVPSAHLLPTQELEKMTDVSDRPTILCGRAAALEPLFARGLAYSDGVFAVLIVDGHCPVERRRFSSDAPPFRVNDGAPYFTEDLNRLGICGELFSEAAAAINRVVRDDLERRGDLHAFCTDVEAEDSTLASRLVAPGVMDISVENRTPWGRLVKTVRLSRPIKDVQVLSTYPLRVSARPDECSFQVALPPRGVSMIRVHCEQ